MDDLGSFAAKISVRERMAVYREFRRILVEQKLYSAFKKTCFRHLRHIPKHFKFNGQIVHYLFLRRIKNHKKLYEIWFCVNDKLACFCLKEFVFIAGLNYSAYLRESKMKKVLQNEESFHFKVMKNKSITAAKLISLIKGNRLNNQQKLKYALVGFVHAMMLAKNPSKKVDSDHIKMAADLEFFRGYPWGKESFGLTLSYLTKKTDLTKQKQAFVKRNNASYALYDFPWAFLVWIYESFPHLGRYTDKSLDSPLPISYLLRWCMLKCDNIMEGDPFKYKENNTKIVYPYLTPTVREMEQRYMRTFKPYTDEVKDTSIDALKAQLNGMTVLTSSAETKTKIWVTTIMFQIQHLLMIMLVQVDLQLRQTLLTTMNYARVLFCSREVYWILLFFLLEIRG